MYRIDRIKGELKKNGKTLKKPRIQDWAEMALQMIQNGNNLSGLPDEEWIPRLSQILVHIDNDPDLRQRKEEAEATRLQIVKEELLEAVNVYKREPTKAQADYVTSLEKIYSKLLSQQGISQSITLQYTTKFPEDFWEWDHVPENPRINKKTVSEKEWLENESNKARK